MLLLLLLSLIGYGAEGNEFHNSPRATGKLGEHKEIRYVTSDRNPFQWKRSCTRLLLSSFALTHDELDVFVRKESMFFFFQSGGLYYEAGYWLRE